MSRVYDPQPPIMSYEMPPSTRPLFFNNPPANVPSASPASSLEDAELRDLVTSAESVSTKDPTKPCHFLRLPREIRDQIYTYLIPPSGVYRNWVPDLPRVFRRKCLTHKSCWDESKETCSWRGWNKVYEEEAKERQRRWAECCEVEEVHKRTSEAMNKGLELCEGWMRESVGWNALRVRETCKQIGEEAAETIFSTATFRYRHTDFHRKSEVCYLHPSLSPLMAHGRHNINLEIDCSRTHASQSLLHLLTTLHTGPKVFCSLHPRSQVSRLKQYHAPNHPYLTDSSDWSDPSDLGIETDDLGSSNYNPFTLSPLTHHNAHRSPYITPIALPRKFFNPPPPRYSTLRPADDYSIVPQKKWYVPLHTVHANIATAVLSITIPEGRYIPSRRRKATTTATHQPIYPSSDEQWPTTPTTAGGGWKWQPPRRHWSTAFFGLDANATDGPRVANWIHAMSTGWDRLVIRCYRDTITDTSDATTSPVRVTDRDAVAPDRWDGDDDTTTPAPALLGVKALVRTLMGARSGVDDGVGGGKMWECIRLSTYASPPPPLPVTSAATIKAKEKEKEKEKEEQQHPAPHWATIEVRYMAGEDEGRGVEVVLEGRRGDGVVDFCCGVEWEGEVVEREGENDGEEEEEEEEGEEMQGGWENEGAEGRW